MNKVLTAALNEARLALVEFYVDWCPHCQNMMPVVARLREEIGDIANIIQIEGEVNPDLIRKYHLHSYPAWIIFKDGQECWRAGGAKSLGELKDIIMKFV